MWRRSSYCDSSACVEVRLGDDVLIRDSKDPDGPRLNVSAEAFGAFLAGAKAGQFDRTG